MRMENVVKIHNNKDVKFFYQDLIDIVLKCGYCISQAKRHDLVPEMTIPDPEGRFQFIAFSDPHPMIGID